MSFYANLIKWKVSFGGTPVAASAGTFDALTVTTFTAGSVVFAAAGGAYAQDNANLFWNDTTNRLGIGTGAPAVALDIVAANTLQLRLGSTVADITNKNADLQARHYTNAQADVLIVRSQSISGTNSLFFGGGVGSLNAATNIQFFTAATSTTLTGTERMRIDAVGNIGIGLNVPTATVHIKAGTAAAQSAPIKLTSGALNTTPEVGAEEFLTNDRYYTGTDAVRRRYAANSEVIRLRGFTVATLPAGVQGDSAFVTDATTPAYNAALVGGGAVVVPVFFNGTAWVSA